MAVSHLFYCNSYKEAWLLAGPVQKPYNFVGKNTFSHNKQHMLFIWFVALQISYLLIRIGPFPNKTNKKYSQRATQTIENTELNMHSNNTNA